MEKIELLEKLVIVKRKHTDAFPQISIKPSAEIRDSIVNFIGDNNGNATRDDIKKFNQERLDNGMSASSNIDSWLYCNKHLVRRSITNGEIKYYLTRAGRNFYNFNKQI